MMIGGSDVVIAAAPGAPMGGIIFTTVGQIWPESWFQNAEDDILDPIHDPRVHVHGSGSREFFIYPDQEAVDSWRREGATTANLDSMLYFIIGDTPDHGVTSVHMNLVCGTKTAEVLRLIQDPEKNFRASPTSVKRYNPQSRP